MNQIKKIPLYKKKVRPKDLDPLFDRVNVLSKVTGTGGIAVTSSLSGVNIHNSKPDTGRSSYIMEVQSAAAGDSLYTCRKEKLLSAEWSDTAGDDKFDELAATEYTVLNLYENDPEPGYVAHLIAGSLLECWQVSDDGGTKRWVGIPIERLNSVRRAWVKTTPGAVATVSCYLDENTNGTIISVNCDICGGTALNDAVPRLSAGDEIYVSNIGGTWRASFLFQASEDCECTPELGELANVTITAAAEGDFVVYDSDTSEWIDQTPAQVLATLTGTAGAAFSWNSQNLTSVGTIGCGAITSTGNLIIPNAGYIGSANDTDAIQIEADGDVVLTQSLYISQDIIHTGDVDTYMSFTTDRILVVAGGFPAFDFDEAQGQILINAGYADIDFVVAGDIADLITADAANMTVTIGGNLIVSGARSSSTATLTASSDDYDVSGINILFIAPAAAPVVLGGLKGGVAGQVLHIAITGIAHTTTVENQEGVGTQDIYLCDESDDTLDDYGGWSLVCDGSNWYDCDHAKHV